MFGGAFTNANGICEKITGNAAIFVPEDEMFG